MRHPEHQEITQMQVTSLALVQIQVSTTVKQILHHPI